METTAQPRFSPEGIPASAVADALRRHWLTGIECDHTARTDVATCYCTVWRSAPQPNVGEAIERWVEHVMESLK